MEIREYKVFKEDEIKDLYSSVGWTAYTKDMKSLKMGFLNSLAVLAAYDDGKLIGVLRAVGDGHTVVFIQDLLVRPEKQRQGVGTSLVEAVLERFGSVRQTELMTDNTTGTAAFYKKLGFSELSEYGCLGFAKFR